MENPKNVWVIGWVGKWMNGVGWLGGWMDGKVNRCMDMWIDGWVHGWLRGWVDEQQTMEPNFVTVCS